MTSPSRFWRTASPGRQKPHLLALVHVPQSYMLCVLLLAPVLSLAHSGHALAQFTLPSLAVTSVAQQIAVLRQSWIDDLEGRRPLSLLAHYAPDAMLLNSDGTRAEGERAIRSRYEVLFSGTNIDIQLVSQAVAEAGDFAYDSGSYTEQIANAAAPGTRQTHGDYLTIYRKAGAGRWQIVQQAWTESLNKAELPN